jgi:Tol biopolymer transport system component
MRSTIVVWGSVVLAAACGGGGSSRPDGGGGGPDAPAAIDSGSGRYTLTVERNGDASGTVSSEDGAIDCGATCSAAYDDGATVVLTASPDTGAAFGAWTGCDSTDGAECTVTVTAATTVTATFGLAPATILVSAADGDTDAKPALEPDVSADGRYVVFYSLASGFVPGVTGTANQAYRRDVQTNATELVSAISGEDTQGNLGGTFPRISDDGRYVLFYSNSSDLVIGKTGADTQYYRRDMDSKTTVLVSARSGTTTEGSNVAVLGNAEITADGRLVAFATQGTNMVPAQAHPGVFLRDVETSATTHVSVPVSGSLAPIQCSDPDVNADGTFVAFMCFGSNLVEGFVAGGINDGHIYLRDVGAGVTHLVSHAAGTTTQAADSSSLQPNISPDGRYVVFSSSATNLVTGVSGSQIYLYDHDAGTVSLASAADGDTTPAESGSGSGFPRVSEGGRYVFFSSSATNLVPGTPFDTSQKLHRRDTLTGGTVHVSLADGTNELSNGGNGHVSISPTGSHMVWESNATNLVPGVTSGATHVYLRVVGP